MYAAVFPLVRTRALREAFDYAVPQRLRGRVRIGSIISAPLGPQIVLGVVVGVAVTSVHAAEAVELRDVVDLPPLPEELVALAARVRDYYLTSLGTALALITPPASAVGLERTAVLTAAGRAELAAGRAELLPYEAGVVVKGSLRPAAALTRLRREGLVDLDYRLHVMEPERESRCLAAGESASKRLGARQKAALALLERAGTCDERTLLRDTSLSQAGLERLLAAGAVRVVEPGTCGSQSPPAEPPLRLLPEQEAALKLVRAAMRGGGEVLLHGVTGSGKTEVYLQAAAEALAAGRSVLILVPEISLTGQTIARVRARFPGERVAVLHSALAAGERLAAYRDTASGRARIVIGARSAVFAPLERPGLIVVDEEHDTSYKQENEPRYDARTVARWRAELAAAALVLGSATPSVEAWARTKVHADLPRRVDGSMPPRLEIIDLRDVHEVLSAPLRAALVRTVEAGEKAILFLNRRGVATSVSCAHCGHTWLCSRCDVSMSLFAGGRELRCRTCGLREPAPQICPLCGSVDVGRRGIGTERLEREVAELLPGIDRLRLDSDVAASYTRLRAVLARFAAPGAKVLVGTQMIAKGHHFPEVTLVGVVNADLSLYFPDFRAEERTFAMLLQVGGRSGRGEQPGRVLVQTLNPDARPIALAAAGEEKAFYAGELERRRELAYPPATTLVGLEVSSSEVEKTARAAAYLATVARRILSHGEEVVGPGPLWRERGRYESRLMVKTMETGKTIPAVGRMMRDLVPRFAQRGARLIADVEPEWF